MTEIRDVRLLALWGDDPTEAPMTVDLRLSEDGRVASSWDVFGAFDLDGPKRRPFVLRRDGAIDFGADAANPWRTDLRTIVVAVNARFTVFWNEADSGVYRIVKIAALGAKDNRK